MKIVSRLPAAIKTLQHRQNKSKLQGFKGIIEIHLTKQVIPSLYHFASQTFCFQKKQKHKWDYIKMTWWVDHYLQVFKPV